MTTPEQRAFNAAIDQRGRHHDANESVVTTSLELIQEILDSQGKRITTLERTVRVLTERA